MNALTDLELSRIGGSGPIGEAGGTIIQAGVDLLEEGNWNQTIGVGTSGVVVSTNYTGTWLKGASLIALGSMLKVYDWIDEVFGG